MTNPYRDKPDHQFWSRHVAWPAPGHLDPMAAGSKFNLVLPTPMPVATLGSCFAQHIARELQTAGVPFINTEKAPSGMSVADAQQAQYGVFSARYGNVYTVRQALQLLQRATGLSTPNLAWALTDSKRVVDAFRPAIEPAGYVAENDMLNARKAHLVAVKAAFTQAKAVVFTLGLTEGWVHKATGLVVPLAPGVHGGADAASEFVFHNFDVDEVRADLEAWLALLLQLNPDVKVILTVSPVPLMATFEPRHVLQANTYSKSVLRVAAEHLARKHHCVEYFPSYEIITAPDAWGRYLEDDLRSVRPEGVAHVMRVFRKHFLQAPGSQLQSVEQAIDVSAVVCEEELIEQTLRQSGFAPK